MLIAADRRVFVGRRPGMPEETAWQMPQGGVDKGETPVEAACRELAEEVGTARALLLRESSDWLTYDVPVSMRPASWKNRWHGQAQKWFALAFTGRDSDIDLDAHEREFDDWKWIKGSELPGLVVPIKRPIYETVVKEFADLIS